MIAGCGRAFFRLCFGCYSDYGCWWVCLGSWLGLRCGCVCRSGFAGFGFGRVGALVLGLMVVVLSLVGLVILGFEG